METQRSSLAIAARPEPKSDPAISRRTFVEVTEPRLQALLQAMGFSDPERMAATGAARDVLEPWGRDAAGAGPSMPCDIGDDAFPIELSVAFASHGRRDVRLLVEARGSGSEMASRWTAGLALSRRLEQRHGASLDRLRVVEDLFVPSDPRARFAMWHSVGFRRGASPQLKVYLNPQARGQDRARPVTSEMLRRLGFSGVASALTKCARPEDEIKFVSLDLDRADDARVKVYKVHPGGARQDIERELSVVPNAPRDLIGRFFECLIGSDGPFLGLPISTYIAVASGSAEPTGGTVHFPIRDYVTDDSVVRERLCRLLSGDARAAYERAIDAFSTRALAAGVGMHSYVSLGIERGTSRITVYLSPEAYRIDPARTEAR